MRMARSPAMARTAGSWVGVVGTRSSSLSARRPSCARELLESAIRRTPFRRPVPRVSAARRPSLPDRPERPVGARMRGPPGGRPKKRITRRGRGPKRGADHALSSRRRGCRPTAGVVVWPQMSAPPDAVPPTSPPGDVGTAVLIEAMEAAPAGIWYLTGDAEPVWANARARAFGWRCEKLPVIGGHRVSELVASALRTGRPASVHGALGEEGPFASAVVRPLRTAGGTGVLLVVEPEEAGGAAPGPTAEGEFVDKVQTSLLPPSLPLLPDLWLSGSYHRASSVRAAGGDWYDAVPLGEGRLALVVGDAVGHGVSAAGALCRLRGAMRSSALLDPSPVAVLRALAAFAGQMEGVEGASVFYAVLDASTGRQAYAAAGHPAPLVVGTDGET